MNPDWLHQLAPAHAPPPPGWWPPAPGWWSVAALILLAIVATILWLRRPQYRLRRTALRELKRIETGISDDRHLAQALENLLRRFAVARYGRESVAHLSGETWIAFLATHGATTLAGATGRTLLQAAYGGAIRPDRERWLEGARGFLKGRA